MIVADAREIFFKRARKFFAHDDKKCARRTSKLFSQAGVFRRVAKC
jgi:hypothetical protein